MDGLSVPALVYCGVVLVLSYAIRGSAGFGAVTIPLLALVLPMKILVPVITVLGILSSSSILVQDRRHIDWRELWRLLPFSLVGALIGLYFFDAFDARTLARSLGALVLVYGSYGLWQSWGPVASWNLPLPVALPLAGTTAGFVGTLFGSMAGLFYAMYLDMQRLGKNEFRATVAATLLALGIIRAMGYVALGAFNNEALLASAAALPLMLVGVVLGNRIHTNLNQIVFRRMISFVLIASGLPLLLK